jgi:Cytosol aminopeptidase family, N-terminal domain
MGPSRIALLAAVALALPAPAGAAAAPRAAAPVQGKAAEIQVSRTPIAIRILIESPADTQTDLQVICLFRSDPANGLEGSLAEANQKLNGLLDAIRKPSLFRGELGETLLIVPPVGTLSARKLLIIGLGDSQTYTPDRMELVGAIFYREVNRLGVGHPFFAATVLDGGVTGFSTGDTAEQFVNGLLRAMRTERTLKDAGAASRNAFRELTFLAGPTHAKDTQAGIEKALTGSANK